MSGSNRDSNQAHRKATQPSQTHKRRLSGECAGTSTGGPTTATPSKVSRSNVGEMHAQGQGAAVVSSRRYIFVFGGDAATHMQGSVACYDIEENKWEIQAEEEMPISGYGSAAAWFRSKIYVTGGIFGDYTFNDLHIYDPMTHSWRGGKPMLENRAFHGMIGYANKLYAIGGFTNAPKVSGPRDWSLVLSESTFEAYENYQECDHREEGESVNPRCTKLRKKQVLSSVESFDGDKWEICPSMCKERYAFGITLRLDAIYVGGGIRSDDIASIEYYDGREKWSLSHPSLPNTVAGCALGVIDNNFFCVGGNQKLKISKIDGEMARVENSTIPSGRERRNSLITFDGDNVYIIGGLEAGGQNQAISVTVKHIDRYNIRTGEWSQMADMEYGRCGCPAVFVELY